MAAVIPQVRRVAVAIPAILPVILLVGHLGAVEVVAVGIRGGGRIQILFTYCFFL